MRVGVDERGTGKRAKEYLSVVQGGLFSLNRQIRHVQLATWGV